MPHLETSPIRQPQFLPFTAFDQAEAVVDRLIEIYERNAAFLRLAFQDVLAQGALLHMPSLGLAAPSDLSVIGIDDLPGSASVPPGLTTVHLPVGQMGEHAADQLAGWVEGRGPAKPFEVKPRLIVRGSTAAPRKK